MRADGRDAWEAEAVVVTCPAHRQAALVAEVDAELAVEIGMIPYNRVVVVALGYRQADVPTPMDGFGFIAPQKTPARPARRAMVLVDLSGPGADQMRLLRAICGGWQRPEIVDWDDGRLLQALQAELRVAMGITAAPIFHRIVRWDRAIPQYHLGHLERVARIERRLQNHPGLWLGGNAYHGVALNDCSEQGALLAEKVATYLTY